ncbi:MAG: phosphomannomutase, partial [Sphingomicrobium sp.]
MTHKFHPSILREYDVRGIVGDTLSAADARALGRSYGALAIGEGARRIAVGRDGRTHSPELEAALIDGLTASGLDVVRIGMGPSPMLYFATATLGVDGGIQVTGSHNPADYNGFKMLLNGRSVFGEEIQALGARAAAADWVEGDGSVTDADVLDAYVARVTDDFQGGTFNVGWDAGNGAAGPALEKLIKHLPGEHHAIFTEVIGTFPNHHPD